MKQLQTTKQQTKFRQLPKLTAKLLALNETLLRTELVLRCQENPLLELVETTLPEKSQAEVSLVEHVTDQLEKTPLTQNKRADALVCANFLDNRGYLPSVDNLTKLTQLPSKRINAALKIIRNLDPAGIGAHNLVDSMLYQLKATSLNANVKKAAINIITNYFDELSRRRYDLLPKTYRQQALDAIMQLQPNFANTFATTAVHAIPELEVYRVHGIWKIKPIHSQFPVKVDEAMLKAAHDDKQMQKLAREANILLTNLKYRQLTLCKVAQAAVDRQRNFFEHGPDQLIPLKLATIARTTNLAISTVSTIIKNKFITAPQGIFALKYLFQRATNDKQTSVAHIQESIKKIVAEENPAKPLSDQKIMHQLHLQGQTLARRTVTKHRIAAGILATNLRHKKVFVK